MSENQSTKTITARWLGERGIQNGCPFVFSRSAPWAETLTTIEVIKPILYRKTTHNFIVFMRIQVKTTNELLYFRYNDLKLR